LRVSGDYDRVNGVKGRGGGGGDGVDNSAAGSGGDPRGWLFADAQRRKSMGETGRAWVLERDKKEPVLGLAVEFCPGLLKVIDWTAASEPIGHWAEWPGLAGSPIPAAWQS
jgi:hypothetical protein